MDFFDSPLTVAAIVFACHVPAGQGDADHRDRPSHGVALHLSGHRVYHFSDGERIEVTAGDLIFLPERSTYTVRSEEAGECYAINFRITEDLSLAPFRLRLRNPAPAAEAFRAAEAAYRTRPSGWREKCFAELYAILALLRREHDAAYTPTGKAALLAPALAKIRNSFTDDKLRADDLAALAGISTVYFRRLFGEMLGTTPARYVLSLRILRAKELLASGLYTAEKVAELSGFSDPAIFCRRFRKETGMTPIEYKSSVK